MMTNVANIYAAIRYPPPEDIIIKNINLLNSRITSTDSQAQAQVLNEIAECADLVSQVVGMLGRENSSESLLVAATYFLCHISTGASRDTKSIIDASGVPILFELSTKEANPQMENYEEIRCNAAWTLANICSDQDPQCLKCVLQHDLFGLVAFGLNRAHEFNDFRQTAIWLLRLIADQQLTKNKLISILPKLSSLILTDNREVQENIFVALGRFITDDVNRVNAQIIVDDPTMLPAILSICEKVTSERDFNGMSQILRFFVVFTAGTNEQAQAFADLGGLRFYSRALKICDTEKPDVIPDKIVNDCCWGISNIVAGSKSQTEEMMTPKVMKRLLSIYDKFKANAMVRKQIFFCFSNCILHSSPDYIMRNTSMMAMKILIDEGLDGKVCVNRRSTAITALLGYLRPEGNMKLYFKVFKFYGGLQKLTETNLTEDDMICDTETLYIKLSDHVSMLENMSQLPVESSQLPMTVPRSPVGMPQFAGGVFVARPKG